MSFAHYDYIIGKVNALSSAKSPACLDFGCWRGSFITYARSKGLDITGLDIQDFFTDTCREKVRDAGLEIGKDIIFYDGKTFPFEDESYDVVIANMVFEHIKNPEEYLAEINRILKKDGVFLALFPTAEAIWEDHVKLFFVHKMGSFQTLQYNYIALMHKLGFGKPSGRGQDTAEYTKGIQKFLNESAFYHPSSQIFSAWKSVFGNTVETDEVGYMHARLQSHPKLKRFAGVSTKPVVAQLLKLVSILRATRVFIARKNSVTMPAALKAA